MATLKMAVNLKVQLSNHNEKSEQIHSMPFTVGEGDDVKKIKLEGFFLPIQSNEDGGTVLIDSSHFRILCP